ncbi:MAG TPA: hypothetical protein PKE32_09810 [Miltoncostaeaceae bacterium]|nr:hypothetical protein [Miltoncostaeaceae bacterium]
MIAAQTVASIIPLLPGNAGAQQAAIAFALGAAATPSTAVAFGVGMQAATLIADVAIGVAAVASTAVGDGSLRQRIGALRSGVGALRHLGAPTPDEGSPG